MKRQIKGISECARDSRPEIPDGIFLVRIEVIDDFSDDAGEVRRVVAGDPDAPMTAATRRLFVGPNPEIS